MARPGFEHVYLVTGFPSFSARKLVEHLLCGESGSFIYATVMDSLLSDAAEVVESLPDDKRRRVEIIVGDAASMDLGLSGQEFRKLSREVDTIHHLAHVSYVGVDAEQARALNTLGAVEILELAAACDSLRCLVYHSTALVSGDRKGVVYEQDLDSGQGFRNVVEETRMRGEKIIRAAIPRIPIAIVRPTNIVGDSGTGENDRFDGPYLLVLLMMTTPPDIAIPIPGRGESPFQIVPVDFVVRAAHSIGNNPAAIGKTFHLVDPAPMSVHTVFDLIARIAGRRAPSGSFPSNLAKALLRTPGIERFARAPRTTIEQLSSDVRYDSSNADRILADTDIRCPPFESYADQLVTRVQTHLREKQRRKVPPPTDSDALDEPSRGPSP